jgi:hypothetical protein
LALLVTVGISSFRKLLLVLNVRENNDIGIRWRNQTLQYIKSHVGVGEGFIGLGTFAEMRRAERLSSAARPEPLRDDRTRGRLVDCGEQQTNKVVV